MKTEDAVSEEACRIMGLISTPEHKSGVGQLTTFNQLGFKGVADKPDGWHLPKNTSLPAIVLEFKNSDTDIKSKHCIAALKRYITIVRRKYDKVIGILYNGQDVLVFKNEHQADTRNKLFTKEYYLKLFSQNTIDKNLIYALTKDINNNLHNNFGMKNLAHRMVFTACALVAKRYGAPMIAGMSWETLQSTITSTLERSYEDARRQNAKLSIILDCFSAIKSNFTENQEAIDEFIETVGEISKNINSDYWNGEDVMGIFFNEFTRYKGKSEQGQVFTPEHIASLMYRITGTNYTDRVLDICCGSGMFLVKSMSNMIKEVGGINNEEEVRKIKANRLFGVEIDKEMYALACANMLIHKDGKTNLDQNDSRTEAVGGWIRAKRITKVLMNPPYEQKYGCLEIVENALDNVTVGAICAFILPETKLEIHRKIVERWLKKHTLLKIIKLPDIFAGMASTQTSIFVFKAHQPQNNTPIFGCWIKDDGLEVVKNQGRHDTKGKWQAIEEYWANTIYRQSDDPTIQWINPADSLCYKSPDEQVKIDENEIRRAVFSYIFHKHKLGAIDYRPTTEKPSLIDTTNWRRFPVSDIFDVGTGGLCAKSELNDGTTPRITVSGINNGITGNYADIDSNNYRVEENLITFSFLGTCFYHPYRASLDMKVHSLKPRGISLNAYIGLFLVVVLTKTIMASYTDQMSSSDLKKQDILLPVNTNKGGPDWEKMEEITRPMYEKIEGLFAKP